MAQPRRFSVVFVCTGNRARSPLAAALLRRRLAGSDVVVDSRGTLDLGPVPALPQAIDAAARLDVDLAAHRAQPLQPAELAASDLVLGFEPEHVAAAVVDAKAPRDRTFTIVELAELLAESSTRGAVDPVWAVQLAHINRPTNQLSAPSVPDPFGSTDVVFRRTFDRIDNLVAVIAAGLFGGPVPDLDPPVQRVRRLFAGRRRR